SGHLLKEQLGNTRDDYLAENTDLWLAQYTDDLASISWPSGTYAQWTLHQYTDPGRGNGIDGNVDPHRFNGPDDDLLAWLSTGVTPAPADNIVTVNITVPAGIEVVVNVEHVNGDIVL